MLHGIVLTLHILVSVFLVVAILLQSGKGSDIGAVFGGAGSQALFGSAGPADFLNKATRVMVVIFMITSLTLGYVTFDRPNKSVMETKAQTTQAAPAGKASAPVAPAAPAKAPSSAPAAAK
ncbi:MAG: preprotein translocase subunit SecG [Syntrophaceae bacterium]